MDSVHCQRGSPLRFRFRQRPVAASYLTSAVLHLTLIVVSVWMTIPAWPEPHSDQIQVRTDLSNLDDLSVEPIHHLEVAEDNVSIPDEERGDSPHDLTIDRPPDAKDPNLAELARRRLEHARAEAGQHSADEQRTDLETLGRRLQQVSSEESVAELNKTLSGWLGTNERTTKPKDSEETESQPFDSSTAQISDVKRVGTEENPIYIAILVDANGNSTEVELDDAEGAQLYETFQLIKRFPLLEQVYRGTVMGLLDKLTAESSDETPSDETPKAPTEKDREQ